MKKFEIGLRECMVLLMLVMTVAVICIFSAKTSIDHSFDVPRPPPVFNLDSDSVHYHTINLGERRWDSSKKGDEIRLEERKKLRERYKAFRESKQGELAKSSQEHLRRARFDEKQILDYLHIAGIDDVTTNRYWYQFKYKGYQISFVNQTSRLCVTKYKILDDKEDKKIIQNIHSIRMEDKSLYNDLCKEYDYSDFIIDGNALDGVMEIINKID